MLVIVERTREECVQFIRSLREINVLFLYNICVTSVGQLLHKCYVLNNVLLGKQGFVYRRCLQLQTVKLIFNLYFRFYCNVSAANCLRYCINQR